MAKAFEPQVLTANRLHEGSVVYWTGEDWSPRFNSAHVAETPEEAAALEALGVDEEVRCQVISPYIFPIARKADGTLDPLSRREHIRAFGPSVPFGTAVEAAQAKA